MIPESSEVLDLKKRGKILILTLNRPERMNAFNLELMQRLEDAWKLFKRDDDLWVAILTGAGDKAFCAGQDLAERSQKPGESSSGVPRPAYSPVGIWKPIIAAINGYALGGGFQLAKECDIRIAAEHAELGIAETRWNMAASWTWDITQVLPRGLGLEIALWGDMRIRAQRAYEIGLVNRVVPKEKLMDEAMSWAERMLSLGPRAVSDMKQIIYLGPYWTPSGGLANAWAIMQNLDGMEDSIEGPAAFSAKRKPIFKNK